MKALSAAQAFIESFFVSIGQAGLVSYVGQQVF
jgi:hypothetical protein